MRQKIILIALGILTNFFLFAKPANITIKLNGYNSKIHKNYVQLKIFNINYPYSEHLKISEKGIIQTTWLIESTKEMILYYDGKELSIIVSPNDDIEIDFKIEDLLIYGNKIEAEISGVNKETNALIYDYGYLVEEWISKSSNAYTAGYYFKELTYQSLREKERENQIQKLNDLIKSNQISNPLFIEWAESKINYAAGLDFCIYPFMGRINKTLTEKDEYFKFIKKFNPTTEFVSHLASYSEYLKTLISSLGIIGNVSNRYEKERINLKKDSLSPFPIQFKIISQTMLGKQREVGLTKIFLNSKDIPDAYIDSLGNYLAIDKIKKIKRNDELENNTILKLLDDFDLREEEKIPLKELYESTKGKSVLHDFWFLECGPCMRELPNYNKLIEKSGDDIKFVFFGVYMQEEKWKEKIEDLNLNGIHYLLSKNQIAFFERYFKLRGFPHHQIIDKSGKIRNENFPRVIPQNFELILNKLNKFNTTK